MKQYYKTTFLIGLGFFTVGLMDPLYDTYVPQFLKNFLDQKFAIGAIMTIDNIFALFLIPIVSAYSDRTRTRIGRRMPYILITFPMTAILFAVMPFAALSKLILLVLAIFLLNLFTQSGRGPVVALMPDTVPGEYRSEANGVINAMGGIAAIVGTLGLAMLMDVKIRVPGYGVSDKILAFPVAGILVLLATLVLFLFVREKEPAKVEEKVPIFRSLKMVVGSKDKSALLILLSLFFWFLAYQGVLPFVGLYSTEVIGLSPGLSAFAYGMVAVSYALFAIPSGIIAHKIGRKKTIRMALIILVAVLVILSLHNLVATKLNVGKTVLMISFWVMMFVFGSFWVSVVTNSFPMLWQMATYSDMGIYTGLYYTFSQASAILAPVMTGAIIDKLGFSWIFVFAAACMGIAFLIMSRVKRGEISDTAAVS